MYDEHEHALCQKHIALLEEQLRDQREIKEVIQELPNGDLVVLQIIGVYVTPAGTSILVR